MSKATLLISGESGVGKEQLSQYIHSQSFRSKSPFIAVNCAAIPSTLLESELFGYEKGAFTGAHQTKIGQIEAADGGTFLLDEISEISLDLQGKLLRVIQEKELTRVGSTKSKSIDVRFICTTNRDLKEMVKKGEFRKDLFYRINVIPIRIPSLRERVQDIEHYSHQFMQRICNENNLPLRQFSTCAMTKLLSWNWPGNVRELQSVLERSILMTQNTEIKAEDLMIEGYAESRIQSFGPGMTVQEAERLLIFKTLEFTGENRTMAAKLLGISIRTLRNKLNEYKKDELHG
jgi:two-component system response regulator FlrC